MKHVEFNIPAVRGMQGGHAIYLAMCPIHLLPKLFPVAIEDSTGESHQSLRRANAARVREIAAEIVEHSKDFHIATVTISVEHTVRFVATENANTKHPVCGELFIPLAARLAIIDGLNRVFGLQRALSKCPSLADDSIAMLIHVDPDSSRRGQLFSDAKRHERPTARSRRIAFDDRDEFARLTREMIAAVPVFANAIETEKSAISNRSRKLFTLSALYQANRVLLADCKHDTYKQRLRLAIDFWREVSKHIPGWFEIVKGDTSAADIRAGYVHCHAIGAAAIARAGRELFDQSPNDWKKRLAKLSTLDWSRSNKKLWEGRAMIGGKLSKSGSAVARAGIVVKRHLGIALSREELKSDK
jgi:DNA sulfur modification protein DndB